MRLPFADAGFDLVLAIGSSSIWRPKAGRAT
jgi:hypothetical protein